MNNQAYPAVAEELSPKPGRKQITVNLFPSKSNTVHHYLWLAGGKVCNNQRKLTQTLTKKNDRLELRIAVSCYCQVGNPLFILL